MVDVDAFLEADGAITAQLAATEEDSDEASTRSAQAPEPPASEVLERALSETPPPVSSTKESLDLGAVVDVTPKRYDMQDQDQRHFTEIHKVTYEWRIPDFWSHWEALRKGGDLSSPPFGRRHEWSLSIARRLGADARTERVGCWVRYLRSQWILPTSLQLNDVSLHALENCLDPWGGLCGVQRLCDADQLPLDGDALVIKCEIVWLELEEKEDWYPQADISLPALSALRYASSTSTMQRDFAAFYANPQLSQPDVDLQCSDGKTISAHRSILRARSPVFAALLERGDSSSDRAGTPSAWVEDETSLRVPLQDVDSETGEALLNFIYTDEIRSPLNIAQAFELMRVSDQFVLEGMKLLVSEWLEAHVDRTNAVDMLMKASLYNSERLQSRAMEKVLQHFDDLDSRSEMDKLDKHPRLMKELMRRLAHEGNAGSLQGSERNRREAPSGDRERPGRGGAHGQSHQRRGAPDHYRPDFRRRSGGGVERLLTEI